MNRRRKVNVTDLKLYFSLSIVMVVSFMCLQFILPRPVMAGSLSGTNDPTEGGRSREGTTKQQLDIVFLYGMGDNANGQLGDGTTAHKYSPIVIDGNGVMGAGGGWGHSLYTRSDGSLWAMGTNGSGQLGDGTKETRYLPVRIDGFGFLDMTATKVNNDSPQCSIWVRPDGSIWGAGSNVLWIPGNGNEEDTLVPVMIESEGGLAAAVGLGHSLIVKSGGSLWVAGDNDWGQLGIGVMGPHEYRIDPVRIEQNGVIDVAAGEYHSLYVKSDGSLWAMGNNNYGQLGDGTNTEKTRPVKIQDSGVIAVDAGSYFSVFLKSDGSLWGMGMNEDGQLGTGNTDPVNTPVQIAAGGVTAVAVGTNHTLYVKEDESLWGMGYNKTGQLGLGEGNKNNQPNPVRIILDEVLGIGAGGTASFYLTGKIQRGSISGKVTDYKSGEAVEGAAIILKSLLVTKHALTDAAGAYGFTDLVPGNYAVIAAKNGYVDDRGLESLALGEAAGVDLKIYPDNWKETSSGVNLLLD